MAHVVVFSGEYDLANKEGLQRELRRLESSDDLVLDLTEVTYIDSTFISELIILEKVRRARSFGCVTIVSPAKSIVRRVFEVAGIASLVGIVESYDAGPPNTSASVVEYAITGDDLDGTRKEA